MEGGARPSTEQLEVEVWPEGRVAPGLALSIPICEKIGVAPLSAAPGTQQLGYCSPNPLQSALKK